MCSKVSVKHQSINKPWHVNPNVYATLQYPCVLDTCPWCHILDSPLRFLQSCHTNRYLELFSLPYPHQYAATGQIVMWVCGHRGPPLWRLDGNTIILPSSCDFEVIFGNCFPKQINFKVGAICSWGVPIGKSFMYNQNPRYSTEMSCCIWTYGSTLFRLHAFSFLLYPHTTYMES